MNKLFVLLIVFCLALGACASPAASQPPTDTLPPPTAVPTNTPAPTATPEPTATPVPTDTPTPEPTATPKVDLQATQEAEAAAMWADLEAEAQDKLAEIKLATDEGNLDWIQTEEISIITDQYQQTLFIPLEEALSFSNYIIHTDVTWDSTGGLAGCGLMLRAQENFDKGPQYRFNVIRLSGYPGWDFERYQYGQWQSTMTGKVRTNNVIDLGKDSTNEFIIVVDGTTFTAYANGTRLGTATDSKLEDGMIAFFTWQDSGETTCKFNNTWIWVLE